ncbi:hypothetical protein GVAV_000769 [Gurleya vavrai]
MRDFIVKFNLLRHKFVLYTYYQYFTYLGTLLFNFNEIINNKYNYDKNDYCKTKNDHYNDIKFSDPGYINSIFEEFDGLMSNFLKNIILQWGGKDELSLGREGKRFDETEFEKLYKTFDVKNLVFDVLYRQPSDNYHYRVISGFEFSFDLNILDEMKKNFYKKIKKKKKGKLMKVKFFNNFILPIKTKPLDHSVNSKKNGNYIKNRFLYNETDTNQQMRNSPYLEQSNDINNIECSSLSNTFEKSNILTNYQKPPYLNNLPIEKNVTIAIQENNNMFFIKNYQQINDSSIQPILTFTPENLRSINNNQLQNEFFSFENTHAIEIDLNRFNNLTTEKIINKHNVVFIGIVEYPQEINLDFTHINMKSTINLLVDDVAYCVPLIYIKSYDIALKPIMYQNKIAWINTVRYLKFCIIHDKFDDCWKNQS